jgi:hypothetical protein
VIASAVRAGLERHTIVSEERFVHQRRQAVEPPDRRLGAELAVAEKIWRIAFRRQLNFFGLQLLRNSLRSILYDAGSAAHDELAVARTTTGLITLRPGTVLGGGRSCAVKGRSCLESTVAHAQFIEVRLKIHRQTSCLEIPRRHDPKGHRTT